MLIHTRLECFERKVLEVLLEEGKKLQTWRGTGDGRAGRGGTGALKLIDLGLSLGPPSLTVSLTSHTSSLSYHFPPFKVQITMSSSWDCCKR